MYFIALLYSLSQVSQDSESGLVTMIFIALKVHNVNIVNFGHQTNQLLISDIYHVESDCTFRGKKATKFGYETSCACTAKTSPIYLTFVGSFYFGSVIAAIGF